ncbi:Polygalacturonase inhibitor 2, partial [Mucuna pruriens]
MVSLFIWPRGTHTLTVETGQVSRATASRTTASTTSSSPTSTSPTITNTFLSSTIPEYLADPPSALSRGSLTSYGSTWTVTASAAESLIPSAVTNSRGKYRNLWRASTWASWTWLVAGWKVTRPCCLGPISSPRLDLMTNAIYERLPRGLTPLKALRQFNVTYNRLCAEIPKGRNLHRFPVSSYVHNNSALSELCNPQDKQALLQFKKELGNPASLSSWLPTTDCCNRTWQGVLCDTDTQTYRVNNLDLTNLNLPQPYPIPPSIGNLPYLSYVFIGSTPNLVGPIPPAIAKLTKLNYLYITHTNVSGQIPDFLSQIKSLVTLDFSYNALSGSLPASLSSLPNLVGITFDGNQISGSIPDSFGSFSNQFTSMTISRNRLTGKIPATLANLNLAFVDLSRNKLEGDASVLFGSGKNTQKIKLAKNLLAFDFGKVGLSANLNGLDLRNNRIYGTLPQGLTTLKFLHTFNVSFNNLCGEIPQGGNLQRFDASSYSNNKCLCGSPLPACT